MFLVSSQGTLMELELVGHLRRLRVELKNKALEHLGPSVVHLWTSKVRADREIPAAAASGVLMRMAGMRFLITAAHVVRDARESGLFYAANGSLVSLDQEFICTSVGQDGFDHFDFAFCELPIGVGPYGKEIELSSIDYSMSSGPVVLYAAIGFPRSKSKKIDIPRRRLKSRRFCFTATLHKNYDYASHGMSESTHIAVPYRLRAVANDMGERVNLIGPTGMSGGALIRLGDLSNPDAWGPTSVASTPRLSGVLIEYEHGSCVVAVRVVVVLREMARRYPELADLLPSQALR